MAAVGAAGQETDRRRDKLSLRRKEGKITSDLVKVRTTVEAHDEINRDVFLVQATTESASCDRSCAESDNR